MYLHKIIIPTVTIDERRDTPLAVAVNVNFRLFIGLDTAQYGNMPGCHYTSRYIM